MPKPELICSGAAVLVKDVVAAAEHYRDKLGFAFDSFHGEPPAFCIVRRDGFYLMLKQAAADNSPTLREELASHELN